jgi:carbohydrate-binding DOMON domain-containing protein
MRVRFYFLILSILLITLLLMGATYPEIYFQMNDPVGDEHGYGSYQYPTNIAFKPYQGLFDITGFKVWSEKKGVIYFDTSFAKITNPWAAPEGFIHQNLRIFINTASNQGLTELPERGAYVRFNPKYPWSIGLKIVGWEFSKILTLNHRNLLVKHLQATMLSDHKTIRAIVPESAIGMPSKHWHYYVFVGSYDGFGEDFFRKIRKDPGEWVFGGGLDQVGAPQVLDILAEATGPHTQEKQLRSFDLKSGKLAELYPVGADLKYQKYLDDYYLLGHCLIVVLLSGITCLVFKVRKIIWFRVKKDNQMMDSN